jgi:hypothetical protein
MGTEQHEARYSGDDGVARTVAKHHPGPPAETNLRKP